MNRNDIIKNQPSLGTLQIINGSIYYATVYGAKIVKIENEKMIVVYEDERIQRWGVFNYTIVYNDSIIFFPQNNDYIYVHRLESNHDEIIDFEKRKNEGLMPYIFEDQLMVFCTVSNKLYKVDDNYNLILLNDENQTGEWKLARINPYDKYSILWDSSACKIMLYDCPKNQKREIKVDGLEIAWCCIDENIIGILDKTGKVHILTHGMEYKDIIDVSELLSDAYKLSIIDERVYCFSSDSLSFVYIDGEMRYEKMMLKHEIDAEYKYAICNSNLLFIVEKNLKNNRNLFYIFNIETKELKGVDLEKYYAAFQVENETGKIVNESNYFFLENMLQCL